MNISNTVACMVVDMPQHSDSGIAIAYNSSLKTNLVQEITGYLEQLQNSDFEIANGGYLAIRDYKKQGNIIDYAIAGTQADALMQLRKSLDEKKQPKLKANTIGFIAFLVMRLKDVIKFSGFTRMV